MGGRAVEGEVSGMGWIWGISVMIGWGKRRLRSRSWGLMSLLVVGTAYERDESWVWA